MIGSGIPSSHSRMPRPKPMISSSFLFRGFNARQVLRFQSEPVPSGGPHRAISTFHPTTGARARYPAMLEALQVITILLVAVAMATSLTHALELPG